VHAAPGSPPVEKPRGERGASESVIVPNGPVGSRSGQPVKKLKPESADPCPPKPG
jgi:hypothetical protein